MTTPSEQPTAGLRDQFRAACEQFDARYTRFQQVFDRLMPQAAEIRWCELVIDRIEVESAYGGLARCLITAEQVLKKLEHKQKELANSAGVVAPPLEEEHATLRSIRDRSKEPFVLLWKVHERDFFHEARRRMQTTDETVLRDVVSGAWESLQRTETAQNYNANKYRWTTWARYYVWSAKSEWLRNNKPWFTITKSALRELTARLDRTSLAKDQVTGIQKALSFLIGKRFYAREAFVTMVSGALEKLGERLHKSDVDWIVNLLCELCFGWKTAPPVPFLDSAVVVEDKSNIDESGIDEFGAEDHPAPPTSPPGTHVVDCVSKWLDQEFEKDPKSAACFYMHHYHSGIRDLPGEVHDKLLRRFPKIEDELKRVSGMVEKRIGWLEVSQCVFDKPYPHTSKNHYRRNTSKSLQQFLNATGIDSSPSE